MSMVLVRDVSKLQEQYEQVFIELCEMKDTIAALRAEIAKLRESSGLRETAKAPVLQNGHGGRR